LAAPGALMFRKNNDAFRRTTFRHLQYYVIGRGCLLEHDDLRPIVPGASWARFFARSADQLPTWVSSSDKSIARGEWVSAPTEM
jgi:hypothetical protein